MINTMKLIKKYCKWIGWLKYKSIVYELADWNLKVLYMNWVTEI